MYDHDAKFRPVHCRIVVSPEQNWKRTLPGTNQRTGELVVF
jgi:hypothetical protein